MVMAINSTKLEEEFFEAKNNWNLERLYIDLASAKGKALTPVEKKFLRGLLCGYSPAEIATTVYQSRSSSTVRVYLSNGLYKYMEEMLSVKTELSVKIKNWSRVTQLLEKAGYKKNSAQFQPQAELITANYPLIPDTVIKLDSAPKQDWGEAIDVSIFQGRNQELAKIEQWITVERCRLVILLGISGIGKTALSVRTAEQLQDKFDCVIWRSLRLAPPLEVLLNQLMQFLSHQPGVNLPEIDGSISQLIDCLRSTRCLIVLDHVDAILCGNDEQYLDMREENTYVLPQIKYRQGYEGYGELIRRLGESRHQSCLILTSREKPQEIAALQGETLPVRACKLSGLSTIDTWKLLQDKGFVNSSEEECRVLGQWYGGNPLFVKLVATAIQELFGGNIYEFLEQGTMAFGDIRHLLDQQFNRLSDLEKQIMYWLALKSDFVSLRKLQKEIFPQVSQRLLLEAIELLQRRSLIERQSSNFSQTPVVMEYIAERLIQENFKSSGEKETLLLASNCLFESQLKNHIRESRMNAEM